MKSVNTRSLQVSDNLCNKLTIGALLSLKEPFIEHDILTIQDTLLTPGLYTWQVSDLQKGRAILKLFLSAISLYTNISCYSDEIDNSIFNIKQDLDNFYSYEDINSYFIENFHADFLWIEYAKTDHKKIEYVLHALETNNFNAIMPIVVIEQE